MKTLNQLLPVDMRVSMLQTATNVAGDNFHGKKIAARQLLSYAFEIYKGMINQVIATERGEVMVPKPEIAKVKNAKALLKRVSKKQRKLSKKPRQAKLL